MAARKPAAKVSDTPTSPSPDAKPDGRSGNLGPITDQPINPAIDPNATAQERLDALTAQQKDMAKNPV